MDRDMRGTAAIEGAFCGARGDGRRALITYLTLGYPSPSASLELVPALEAGGADIIELGVPFSDPVADGPAIQRASHAALQQGVTPADCLAMAEALRAAGVRAPFVFMGYYNPIFRYGVARYIADCAAAGVDGLIVPDLPPEEAGALADACRGAELSLIYLVAPTSDEARIAHIAGETSGFLYVISRLGTTGAEQGAPDVEELSRRLALIRRYARTPVAVGFGISRPAQVRAIAPLADGIIVGSAVVRLAEEGPAALREYTASLRAALEG